MCFSQRIPKFLVPVIKVKPTGNAWFVFGDFDVVTEANYSRVVDGRMRFNDGWLNFASECKLKAGMMVLMLFHIINDKLHISFDVISN